LLALNVVCVLIGVGLVRSAKTPAPAQAVEEARANVTTFREGIRAVAKRKTRSAAASAAAHTEPVATAEEPLSTPPGGTDGQD
jgi:hypothetical protein